MKFETENKNNEIIQNKNKGSQKNKQTKKG